jgi:hypothetical protein
MKKKFGALTLREVNGICGKCRGMDVCPSLFKKISTICIFYKIPLVWPIEKELEITECFLKQ